MKNLIRIAQVVSKQRVQKIEIFDHHNLKHRDSKFNEFYLALQDHKFRNDQEAAALLYDCDPGDPRYRQLKSRFRRRLLNTLFFLDVNKSATGNYQQAYYHSNREWTQINILLAHGANEPAAELARRLLTTALKYQFSALVIGAARHLSEHAVRQGNQKAFDTYQRYIEQYTILHQAELRAEKLHQQALLLCRQAGPTNAEETTQLEQISNELLLLSEKHDSWIISFTMFFSWILRFETLRDFPGVLEVTDQAERFLEHHPDLFQPGPAARLYARRMTAYLHLKQFKEGLPVAERSLKKIPRDIPEWLTFMEVYLLLALHTRHYVQATAILQQVAADHPLEKMDSEIREKWQLYEAFLPLVVEIESDRAPLLIKSRRASAHVRRLLEHPPDDIRKSRPFFFHILLLKLLYLLPRQQHSVLINQIEQLYTFTLSYLRRDIFFRHNQLARLLHQLARADLNPQRLSNTAKYEKRLLTRPFYFNGKISELELLPFEELWDLIRDYLQR